MTSTRSQSREKIYLIGFTSTQIVVNKLPSVVQVLRVFFHNHRQVKLTVRDSAKLVIEEVEIFWEKARIPIREKQHCIKKVERLYEEWKLLQKHATRKSDTHKQKEDEFVSRFNDLFDISHPDALETMTNEENKEFLILQKQKNRPGFIRGVDHQLAEKEQQIKEQAERELLRKQRNVREMNQLGKFFGRQFHSSKYGSCL